MNSQIKGLALKTDMAHDMCLIHHLYVLQEWNRVALSLVNQMVCASTKRLILDVHVQMDMKVVPAKHVCIATTPL